MLHKLFRNFEQKNSLPASMKVRSGVLLEVNQLQYNQES